MGMRAKLACSLLLQCYKQRNLQEGSCLSDISISRQPTLKNNNSPPDQTLHSAALFLGSKNSCFSAKFRTKLLDGSLSSQQV